VVVLPRTRRPGDGSGLGIDRKAIRKLIDESTVKQAVLELQDETTAG